MPRPQHVPVRQCQHQRHSYRPRDINACRRIILRFNDSVGDDVSDMLKTCLTVCRSGIASERSAFSLFVENRQPDFAQFSNTL
jgi:hypothetical protein